MHNKVLPKNLQTDLGKEFYNIHLKEGLSKCSVYHYRTFSNIKTSIVEQDNRTIKQQIMETIAFTRQL